VRDKSVSCLRTFVFPTLFCHYAIENIYYVPVEKRSFREIRIEILTLEGVRVPFKDSKSTTKADLHFRRVPTAIQNSCIVIFTTFSMNHLVQYYLRQAGRNSRRDRNGIGPVYASPLYLQRGHGIGSFLGGLFRSVRPFVGPWLKV
jgi:hypothetical protein